MKHDYQCNAAMGLCKKLQAQLGKENAPKNPRECAQKIMDNMPGLFFLNEIGLMHRKSYGGEG